jgi:hypothetical protein
MQAARLYSCWTVLHVRTGSDPDRRRQMLCPRERNDKRRLLLRAGQSVEPRQLPGANAVAGLRERLHQNVGRDVLQQSQCRSRRQDLRYAGAVLRKRRIPRRRRHLRAGRVAALRDWRDGRQRRQLRPWRARSAATAGPATTGRSAASRNATAKAGMPARPSAQRPRGLRAGWRKLATTLGSAAARATCRRRPSRNPLKWSKERQCQRSTVGDRQ